MSPRPANPNIRVALIEEAARVIAEDGEQALSLRRLTDAVGVSTMAVYTHFGGLDELRRAVRQEGFDRLAARMAEVEPTDDPVADLAVLGWVYVENGLRNANLYRTMFMEEGFCDVEPADTVGLNTFAALVAAVKRAVDAGRLVHSDPVAVAQQLWVAGHGCVSLALCGHLTTQDAFTTLQAMGDSLLRGVAADRVDAGTSLRRAEVLIAERSRG